MLRSSRQSHFGHLQDYGPLLASGGWKTLIVERDDRLTMRPGLRRKSSMGVEDARQRISKPLPTERPVCDPEYLNRLAERLSITAGLSRELARRRVMSMTRRAISAGPDRSYVVRPRRCYCTMTVAPIWTRL
jgi:hypothetical protein